MDPSSIITQVNLNGLKEESNDVNIKSNVSKTSITNAPRNQKSVDKSTDYAKSDAGCHPRPGQAGSGGGGGGSRFLSQLLCCFGLGHTPDYAASQQQQQKGEKAAVMSEQQQLHLNRDGPAAGESCYELRDSTGGEAACLLSPAEAGMAGRICAVIDLDETLVHSSFRCNGSSDFAIQVEVDGTVHQVYVLKRPFADEFLTRMGQLFECVLFTASMGKYADPVSDMIDPGGAFKHRLFRESCVYHCDSYVKDLATLGRPVDRCVIIDNSPASYMFNVENAIRVQTWMGERDDTELRDLLPYMEELARADSVSAHLRNNPPPQSPPMSMEQLVSQMQRMEDDC